MDFATFTLSRYTLYHLGNAHLKEQIAVTRLKMVKYRCSQCPLEIFTSDAMIHHRTKCSGTYIELPAFIGMKALDEFRRLCDEAFQQKRNRKMEVFR
ncbi:unnamed protein product, partial [Mesorhabditis belari]|uniref:Uncharacterized protein n=1 Tax=Mesorhabditis belari TaxID=2138241 RepID=A0AAF3EUJ0_9BILA